MIADLFAGAGGWSQGARGPRPEIVGVELDPSAAQTHRDAHGRGSVLEADVRYLNPVLWAKGGYVEGLLASPPCQTFSRAGRMSGLPQLPQLREAVSLIDGGFPAGAAITTAKLTQADERTLLVLEPMRWVAALEKQAKLAFVAMEEVPLVLPVFQAYQDALRGRGFSVWTGLLNAQEFGVPQDRERAVLVASRYGPVGRPSSTVAHAATIRDKVDLSKLPDGVLLRPGSWTGSARGRGLAKVDGPAPTLAFGNDHSGWQWVVPGTVFESPVTFPQMSVLQGFPEDYPWSGLRTKVARQIANAIPPPMAAEILRTVT